MPRRINVRDVINTLNRTSADALQRAGKRMANGRDTAEPRNNRCVTCGQPYSYGSAACPVTKKQHIFYGDLW